MSKQYTCELCKKVFNQKIDYTRHKNKKAPCITLTEMQKITQINEVKNDIKSTLINLFKNCLNILRDNEGLTGEKALRNLSYLLTLKLLEPHFGGEIKIDDYDYDFSYIGDDEMIKRHKKRLLEIVRFSNLSKENEDNVPTYIKYLWDDILSIHPSTKNIFLKEKGFDIQHKSTYKKIIDKLNSIDLSKIEEDVLGCAYEDVIKDIMKGKVLGQFFTQKEIKNIMVKLINPQIYPDGKIDICGDPTMGTGGFLITYLQEILKQATDKNIKPDWDFIKTEGLYGKELDPDTYQLALSNMLISSGHMFNCLDRGDSIRDPITKKFDNILSNPPFGIKGLKYDDFQSPLKREYVPIKTDNAVSLFIQAIIYMLKINGKCAIVLPDGQDLFSKTNKTLIAIREYLMKTCDLKEIIYLPAGLFEYTTIKTCVFYFIKKREGTDVLETKIKVSKTQKETGRDYKFSKTHQTVNVKFYDYNPYEDVKNLLVEVPIEKIASNSYSLNYAEYMKDETDEEQYEDGVVVKTLDQIFHITKGTLQSSKSVEGEYTFITASDTNKTHNTFTHDCECVMLVGGAEGSLAKSQYFKGKFIASDLLYVLISKNPNEINYRYAWYYLNFNREKHLSDNTICCGTPKKMISKDRCSNIKIPIPSLERQQEIVKYLDFIYEKVNKTSSEKIKELKELNEFCLNNQKIFGDNVIKTLGEVCKFDIGGTPSRNKNEYYENGNNLWVSVRELNNGYIYDTNEKITDLGVKKSSVKLFAKDTILFSFKLSIGKTAIVGNPLYTNEAIAGILSKNDDLLNNKYLYYYLTINDFTKLGSGLLGNGSLNKKSLEQIKIHIPSLERQKEIVEYCEYNDTLIKQLEKEIENNKKQAEQFITGIVKVQANEETE
jgi:type I restriction-modification system DNA methylase subunit/restriction endonuclease S subunit